VPFQLKDFPSIAASMVNHARAIQNKLTDFNIGSVARTMLEAPAVEIEELYQQMFIGLKEGIPVATYSSFGFEKRAAEPAVGVIRFTAGDPAHAGLDIAEGVRAKNAAGTLQFRTTAAASIPAGAMYADVPAVCETPGLAGNVAPGVIAVLQDAVTGVSSAANPAWFFGGKEIESDDEQKARFAAFVATLPRGTKAAIEYGARMAVVVDGSGLAIEAVRHAFIDEPYLADPLAPVGLVDCFIHNGAGGTSAALAAEAKKIIDGYREPDGTPVPGWKAAGVIVNVYAAQEVVVAVDGALSVSKYAVTATAAAQAEAAIAAYFDGLKIGAPVYASEIIAAVMNVDGVVNFQMTSPAADVVVARHQKAMLGAVRFG
jgi:uncharacterized phage protein gp47/JayE